MIEVVKMYHPDTLADSPIPVKNVAALLKEGWYTGRTFHLQHLIQIAKIDAEIAYWVELHKYEALDGT